MTKDQIDLLKTTICKGATDDQLKLFIQVCNRTQLDPFSRQIYGIPSGGRLQIQVSIDGLRLIAERSNKYRGQVGPYFCGRDGNWSEVWLDDGPPVACKVGVLHKDFDQPLFAIVKFSAYALNTPVWNKIPETMIAKVAESLALRKAFPQDLSGIYSDQEIVTSLPPSTPQITQSKDVTAAQATKHEDLPLLETEPQQAMNLEIVPPVEVTASGAILSSYTIPFGNFRGKTIEDVGLEQCLSRVKWFEDDAKKTGKPISGAVLKFKEMVKLAVQMGMS